MLFSPLCQRQGGQLAVLAVAVGADQLIRGCSRLHLGPWVRDYRTRPSHGLDVATYQSLGLDSAKEVFPWNEM